MKNYTEFINEELGEGTSTPYSYQNIEKIAFDIRVDLVIRYRFKTDDDDEYIVRFYNLYAIQQKEKYFEHFQVEFVTSDDNGDTIIVNKGRFYKVMSTIISIIKDFIKNYNPVQLKINPISNFKKDKRRQNIYIRYIERLLPIDYKYKKSFFGNSLLISKK